MKVKKITALFLTTAMMIATFAGCGTKTEEVPETGGASKTENSAAAGDYDKMTIKISTVLTEDSISGKALQMLADELEEKSGGAVKAEVYYNGVLADTETCFEMIQNGDIQMMTLNPVAYETQVTELATLDEYYMFDDLAHAHRFLEGEGGKYLNDAWQSVNLQGLATYGLGFRELSNNKKEIKTIEDMKGLTLRGYSTIQIDAWKAVGAAPTSVDWNELFVSMQQGLLDGQESALSTINDFSFYEVQKYVSLTDHAFTMDWLVGSLTWLDELSDANKALVMEAVNDSYEWQKKAYQEDIENLVDKFTNEYGVTVTELEPEVKAELKEKMGAVTVDAIKATAGEDVYNTVHEYVEAAR